MLLYPVEIGHSVPEVAKVYHRSTLKLPAYNTCMSELVFSTLRVTGYGKLTFQPFTYTIKCYFILKYLIAVLNTYMCLSTYVSFENCMLYRNLSPPE